MTSRGHHASHWRRAIRIRVGRLISQPELSAEDEATALTLVKEVLAEHGATSDELEGVTLIDRPEFRRLVIPSELARRLDAPHLPAHVNRLDLEEAAIVAFSVARAFFVEMGDVFPSWPFLDQATQEGWVDTAYEVAATGETSSRAYLEVSDVELATWQAADVIFIATVTAKLAQAIKRNQQALAPTQEPTP